MNPVPVPTTSGFVFTSTHVNGPRGSMEVRSIAAIEMFSLYSLEELRYWDYMSEGLIKAGRTHTGRRKRTKPAVRKTRGKRRKPVQPYPVAWYEVPMARWPRLPYVFRGSGFVRQHRNTSPRANPLRRANAGELKDKEDDSATQPGNAAKKTQPESERPRLMMLAVASPPMELEAGGNLGINIHDTPLRLGDGFVLAFLPSLDVRWQGLYLDMKTDEDSADEDSGLSDAPNACVDVTGSLEPESRAGDTGEGSGGSGFGSGRPRQSCGLSRSNGVAGMKLMILSKAPEK